MVEEYRSSPEFVDLFGVILYSDEHANVKKVLRDEDYWKSFNELSGTKWAIFLIKPKKGRKELPPLDRGELGMMIPVWKEPNENKRILDEFELSSTEKLPLLVIFTHTNGDILQSELELNDESVDAAYRSIKDALSLVAGAITKLHRESKNSENLYNTVRYEIGKRKLWKILKKGVNFYSWVNSLLP